MSSPDVNPGATETQQMRVVAPVGVSHHVLLYWRIVKLLVFFFFRATFVFGYEYHSRWQVEQYRTKLISEDSHQD